MGYILGGFYYDRSYSSEESLIRRMAETIHHRGKGYTVFSPARNARFANGFSAHSDVIHSSFVDEAEGVSVFMDGEIFGSRPGDGNDPGQENHSDSRTISRLYRKYGESFAERIDGSYAIAIYDEVSNSLLLLRDRVGYKPLFYLPLNRSILFASEIKAILASRLHEKTVDLEALNGFLSYGYIPNPRTLFGSIRQVRPGQILVCENGTIREKEYWKFRYREGEEGQDEAYYTKKFKEVLEAAVSKRLRRHSNAGAFLSGGLDTSAVVAMMHKVKNDSFKVFTAGFKEEKYNEISDAKVLVDHFNLEHHVVLIEFDENFPSLLEKIIWYHDGPFADTSAIPSYYAAKLAKEYVDTVLTGDFPDQLIGGSGHHVFALNRLSQDNRIFRTLRNKGLNRFISGLRWSAGSTSLIDRVKRKIHRETFPLEEQRILLNMPVPPLLKRCLYSPDLLQIDEKDDPMNIASSIYDEVRNENLLNKLLYFDTLSYAPDDLMVKVERMTMAHGLNAISPFHDLELVEFIASVPSHLKINGTTRKYIMREALRPLLPEYTLNKRKQGFAMPIGEWLVAKMSDYVRDVLLDSKTLNRGYFDKKFVMKMVGDFLAGKTDYATGSEGLIISLITLELWHRLFIDN